MSIILNNHIYTLLKNQTGITKIVGLNIFPIIIPQNTTLPAIVIRRSFTANYTRDGQSTNDSTVEITVISENYNETIALATAVDNALNFYKGTAGNKIIDCRLTDCNELFQEDSFIQNLTYVVKNIG
jgi:hypothetical protein